MIIPHKKTKIIATLGPASDSVEIIEKLIKNGVNVFRLNFSHGSHEMHERTLNFIAEASQKLDYKPAILADLQGPKIRTGRTPDDEKIELKEGSKIRLTTEMQACSDKEISIDYPNLMDEVQPESRILINDGAIGLKVVRVDQAAKTIECDVLNSGFYSSHKGVNFPDTKLSIPALTEKDLHDLEFILAHDFQFIALSFVRKAGDVQMLQNIISGKGKNIKIIAKIEKPEAAAAIDPILEFCDGIMVARGDLGVETSVAEVPIIQKNLIDNANAAGKTVIVATQMLESMIQQPLPTRAESTDVANALFDGADAVMLSGETAAGKYPVESVRTMTEIIHQAENSEYYIDDFLNLDLSHRQISHAVCEAAAWASRELNQIPILVFTISGATAWYLSNIRANAPIYAFSPDKNVVAQLALAWNVQAFEVPFSENMSQLVEIAEKILVKRYFVEDGDLVVVINGTGPIQGATNLMRIKKIGEA